MTISINTNQFQMSDFKGKIGRGTNPVTLPVSVYASSVATIVAGDALKLVDVAGGTIIVDKCAVTDTPIGFAIYAQMKPSWTAGDSLEIACFGSVMTAEASAAISAGADLEYVVTGSTMKTNAGTNPISGVALTPASGSGALFLFLVKTSISFSPTVSGGTINNTPIGATTPSTGAFTTLAVSGAMTGAASGSMTLSKRVRATIAEVNAGKTLLAAVTGLKYRLISARMIAVGGAVTSTNATGIAISGTQGASSVALMTVAKAALTQSALVTPSSANVTLLADGASFVQNDAATAITAAAVADTDLDTATHVDFLIEYAIEA